ncbi:MAG: trypsin-like peptidase domain-containing protein [Candidatus Berkelbacteria bacterium]
MENQELKDQSSDQLVLKQPRKHKVAHLVFIILAAVLIFVVGGIGGIGTILLFSANNGQIASKLGIKDFSDIAIPTKQKIVIEESSAIIDASNKVSSSVVSITQKKTVQSVFGAYTSEGAGTGFIITSDGLVLTNKHVVADATATYQVITNDGKVYDATVQSLDSVNDLAVMKIDARGLTAVELGDSDELKVGQWVIAVGNSLGKFQNSVTAGVVSAKDRKIQASDSSGGSSETLSDLLQTDAAINPGNSGGPLVNLAGQVVGINTAVAADAQGIGFAIPINAAKSAIDSIKKTGRIIRPYLGVRYFEITPAIAKQSNLAVDHGALVQRGTNLTDFAVVPGSPADKAGVVENDIITQINGDKIDENNSLISLVQKYQVGDEIKLKVFSKGVEKEVTIKLEESKS